MYAIITPTFQPHFVYIKKYLESFKCFLQDPENVIYYFTISRDEATEFNEIIKPYSNLNIRVLIFEDILQKFGIFETPQALLEKYKKFSFQTLKKFYTMLYIPERFSLILDSESMAIDYFKADELFKKFFNAPFISGSQIKPRFLSDFTNAVNQNINTILHQEIPYWFLENFVWFYDKKILHNLFHEYGNPLDLVKKISHEETEINREVGIFEIELYQAYIWKNLNKYKYKFLDIDEQLHQMLSSEEYLKFINEHDLLFEGNCGLLERITDLLLYVPLVETGNFMQKNNYCIIRCDKTDAINYKLQKKFLHRVKPYILAASQSHLWGINNNLHMRFKLLIGDNLNYIKLKKHIRNLLQPFVWIYAQIKSILHWVGEIFSVLFYLIRVMCDFIKNLKIILLR